MVEWKSVDHIVDYFKFDVDASDDQAVRSAIKDDLKFLANDPDFDNKDTSAGTRRVDLNSALDYMDLPRGGRDVVLLDNFNKTLSLLDKVVSSQSLAAKEVIGESIVSDTRDRASQVVLIPRIGSGFFAGVAGFLFMAPEKFSDHKVLGQLVGNESGQLILAVTFIFSAFSFAFTWVLERDIESRVSYFMSESSLALVFDRMRKDKGVFRDGEAIYYSMIFNLFSNIVYGRGPVGSSIFVPRRMLFDVHLVERIVDFHISRLLERGFLREVPSDSVDRKFYLKA